MKDFLEFCYLLFLLTAIYSSNLGAKNEDQITVKIGSFEFPPLFHTSHSGELSGTVGETVKELFSTSNIKYEYTSDAVSRAYHNIESGKSDILLTSDHQRFIPFATQTKWSARWVSGIWSKHPLDKIPDNELELQNKQITVIFGWESPYKFFNNLEQLKKSNLVRIHKKYTITSAIQSLSNDTSEFLWGGENFIFYFDELKIDKNKFHFKALVEAPIYIWVSKKSKYHDEILEILNIAYSNLKSTGVIGENNLLNDSLMRERFRRPSIRSLN